jgi:hypothetical protein
MRNMGCYQFIRASMVYASCHPFMTSQSQLPTIRDITVPPHTLPHVKIIHAKVHVAENNHRNIT